MFDDWKNITALIDSGGDIKLDAKCVATAADESQCLAMLVRRKGESLDALLLRLDAAIADAYDNERFAD